MATESSVMAVIRASRPSFRNPHDKIAFAVHASFLAAGFSLIATGKNALSHSPPTDGDEVGIDGWNELEDSYGFVYTKTGKNSKKKTVLVKCLAIGDILMIDILDLNDGQKEPFNLQMNVKDNSADRGGGPSNYAEMYKNFEGLVKILNLGVLATLEPVVKISSSARSTEESEHGTASVPAVGLPFARQPPPTGLVYPPVPSFGGNSDLYPGPGAGFYPDRESGIGGDMLVGPNDPRWLGSGGRPGFPGGIPGVPPGARFDPYGPPDVPGFEPPHFVRHVRRPGGGTHPDLEHFQGPDYI